jgi:hypothetical protein
MKPVQISLRETRPRPRGGVTLLMVLVLLTLISVLMGLVTSQILANRRLVQHRHDELQAIWLARAGIELAADRILADPAGYKGESMQLIPKSRVRIEVQPVPPSANSVRVISEAQYPTGVSGAVTRSITCHVRFVTKGERVRIEVEPAEASGTNQ